MWAGVSSASSSRRARTSGVGLHSLYTSRTSSGMSMYRSCDTSCLISSIGNNGANASGPIGSCVAGFNGGGAARGKSAAMLYHRSGTSDSASTNLVWSLIRQPPRSLLLGSADPLVLGFWVLVPRRRVLCRLLSHASMAGKPLGLPNLRREHRDKFEARGMETSLDVCCDHLASTHQIQPAVTLAGRSLR